MKELRYPDGELVLVGDIIWTNEGRNIRRVNQILSADEAREMGAGAYAGLMWTRNINPHSSPDVFGFERAERFDYEGVALLSHEEFEHLKSLFEKLGEKLGIDIWENPRFVYYAATIYEKPVLHWYLFYAEQGQESEDLCYRFAAQENRFYEIEDEQERQYIKVL